MSEIKPALTGGDWSDPDRNKVPVGKDGFIDRHYVLDRDKHRLAAQCLHGQPFGFTQEMVDELRLAAGYCRTTSHELWCDDIADLIEALLPPDQG